MRATGEKECEFENESRNFFSVNILGSYTMKLHFLDRLVENITRFADISVLSASDYDQFNVHFVPANR